MFKTVIKKTFSQLSVYIAIFYEACQDFIKLVDRNQSSHILSLQTPHKK
ncbi:MAG: hypothetical protein HON74_02795 [Flavobacteriaceae bacterium]|nr:hypothetical protein [Flavobacteriaceae bacterium]